jgi:hypothetical protein
MSWKPSEDHDHEIRHWMKSRAWPVTRTNYDSEREIYAWRHELRGGKSPTLRISRGILEDYPAFIVAYHLNTDEEFVVSLTDHESVQFATVSGSSLRTKQSPKA